MSTEKLHPDAARVCEMIVAANRPPLETLTPAEAREAYLASRPVLQPDPEDVAEVVASRRRARPVRSRCGCIAARAPARISCSRRWSSSTAAAG